MIKKTHVFALLALLLIGTTVAVAQDGTDIEPAACVALVEQAYEVTQDACQNTGRDEACYGNIRLDAAPESLNFEQTGDIVSVTDIASLRLSSMNIDRGEWGVSLIRVRASLPEEDTMQNVELLLFGNVEIRQGVADDDAATATPPPMPPATIGITAGNNVNVRSIPSTGGAVIGVVNSGTTVIADARNAAGDWVRINLADESATPEYGWVFVSLFTIDGNVDALTITDPNAAPGATVVEEQPAGPVYGPMQAFFFTSGGEDRPCAEAPDSGILIQTPDGAGVIEFLINEVVISLGSTAYLQAIPNDAMLVSVVEGQAAVTANGTSVQAFSGMTARISLDASGLPDNSPSLEASDPSSLLSLPISILNNPITIENGITGLPPLGRYTITASGSTNCEGRPGSFVEVDSFWSFTVSIDESLNLIIEAPVFDGPMELLADGSYFGLHSNGAPFYITASSNGLTGYSIDTLVANGQFLCQDDRQYIIEYMGSS